MGKNISVSFEDTAIKVVFASAKGKRFEIKDALTLRDDQFDAFLQNEKTDEFIVVNSFKDFFQDILLIPPAHKGYLRRLVEAEVRKKAPFKDFTFTFSELGEKVVENRRMKEVFVFAVKNDEVRSIINRFVGNGKVVKALYPDIFAVASQINYGDSPVLCISEAGLNKNLSLIKDGRIQFIRTTRSIEQGISDLDIQNINMTVNYCRQALRTNPSHIILTGSLSDNYNASAEATIPMACLASGSGPFKDYIAPASAFTVGPDSNLLPKEYKDYFRIKEFMQVSILTFLALSVIGIGYAAYIANNISNLKTKTDALRLGISGIEGLMSAYDLKKQKVNAYMPFLTSLNDAASEPDAGRFLSLLSGLSVDYIIIDSISVVSENKTLKAVVRGAVKSAAYAEAQAHYQSFISSVAAKGLNITKHNLDLKDKSFDLEVEFR